MRVVLFCGGYGMQSPTTVSDLAGRTPWMVGNGLPDRDPVQEAIAQINNAERVG